MITVFWLNLSSSQKEDRLPVATFCKSLQEGVLRWNAVVRLPKSFAEKNRLDPEKAVREQIKYLDGFLHFANHDEPRLILLHDLSIWIDSVKQSDDGAVAISYKAEKPVAFCKMPGNELTTLNLSLPFDPYAAYDLVPANFRRVLSFHGETRETNPCADSEIVINSKPDLYWYTWQPQARGLDAFGKAYDCRSILKAGTDYQTIQGHILPGSARDIVNGFQPMMDLQTWKVALVFGFVSGEPDEKTLSDAKRFFSAHPDPASFTFEDKKTQDAAVWAVMDFFDQLKKIADLDGYSVVDRGDHLYFSAQAKLKASGRDVAFEIFLGSTGVGTVAANNFLVEALQKSQIIFYIGHSGAGARIDWTALRARFPAEQAYQVLGVIGCYSTEYFNPLYADHRRSRGLPTVLLRTDFSGYRYLLPLGILSYLDHYQKPGARSVADSLSNYLEADERVLIQQF